MGVGAMLLEHGDGLSQTMDALITSAMASDFRQRKANWALRKEQLASPPVLYKQYIAFDRWNEKGEQEKVVVTYEFLIPGVLMADGRFLEIKKYNISSSFEAMIRSATTVQSDTEISAGASFGGLSLPSVNVDVTEKLSIGHDSESTQKNTLETSLEMGPSEPPPGMVNLMESMQRQVNTVLETALKQGMENPKPLSDDEAKELQKDPDVVEQQGSSGGGGGE